MTSTVIPNELRRRTNTGVAVDHTDSSDSICSDVSDVDRKPSKPLPPPTEDPDLPWSHSEIPVLGAQVSRNDILLPSVLLCVAFIIRFYKLSSLDRVIFDEVHYGKFTNWVLSGEYFFDVNPPFGKLVIALIANALGFDAGLDSFANPGDEISSHSQVLAARAPAALFGSLTVPVFYALCRQLRLSEASSFLGAAFILFDSMHVIQSRMIMVDSLLVFFTCISLLCALLMWDAKRICLLSRKSPRRSRREAMRVTVLLVATGICCGMSLSVRWTAFATPALVLIVSIFGVPPFCQSPLNWLEVIVLAMSMFNAYFGTFYVFLMTLKKSGTGDGFMSREFQMCLNGSELFLQGDSEGSGKFCRLSVWAMFIELNQKIFEYSKGIRGSDQWGSSWLHWCVNWRGALYYRSSRVVDRLNDSPLTLNSIVYAIMNPAMVVAIDFLIVAFTVMLFYQIRYRKYLEISAWTKRQLQRGCVLLFGWMGSMLPTMVVYRSGPIYQYLPGLFFAQALGALTFDLITPKGKTQNYMVAIFCTLLTAAFAHWSPWVYAHELSEEHHKALQWLPGWD